MTSTAAQTDARLNDQIVQAEADLADLLAEKARRDALDPAHRLAEDLHARMCRHNHADGCDWFYGDWHTPHGPYTARHQYLTKAHRVLDTFDGNLDQIAAALDAILDK